MISTVVLSVSVGCIARRIGDRERRKSWVAVRTFLSLWRPKLFLLLFYLGEHNHYVCPKHNFYDHFAPYFLLFSVALLCVRTYVSVRAFMHVYIPWIHVLRCLKGFTREVESYSSPKINGRWASAPCPCLQNLKSLMTAILNSSATWWRVDEPDDSGHGCVPGVSI